MQVYMGGIVPISLASLKTSTCLAIFLAGCDFKCPYCNTPEVLDFKAEYLIDILEAKRRINEAQGSYDTVIFTGGEPTLQRQALLNLSRHCKQIGLKVGIQTNGARPTSILSLLRENILDFIEVDLKSQFENNLFEKTTHSKNFFKQTDGIMNEVKETITLLKKNENNLKIFFKTTIVPGLMDKESDLIEIGKTIENIKCVWILQKFNPEKTLDKKYMELKNEEGHIERLREKLSKRFQNMQIDIG